MNDPLLPEDICRSIKAGEATPHYTRILSHYYLELERLLVRVGESGNHYYTLEIERSASKDEVTRAYLQAMKLLEPVIEKTVPGLTEDFVIRGKAAVTALSEAFGVLSHFGKRTYYDNEVMRPAGSRAVSVAAATVAAAAKALTPTAPQAPPVENTPDRGIRLYEPRRSAPEPDQSTSALSGGESSPSLEATIADSISRPDQVAQCIESNDHADWIPARVPLEITGYDQQGIAWTEIVLATALDQHALLLKTRRPLMRGSVLQTNMLQAWSGSPDELADLTSRGYAVVSAVAPAGDGASAVTVVPIGPRPPEGYRDQPWAAFDPVTWPTGERRENSRVPMTEALRIEYLDKDDVTVSNGIAVTENVSAGGARIYVEAAPADFDKVRVVSLSNLFNAMAMIRHRYRGKDGFERICLQFIDREWPVFEPLNGPIN